jgi:insulysin
VFLFRSSIFIKVFLFLFLFVFLNSVQAKDRQTRILALENGLDVLLIHDAEVHRSAAALAVGTGYYYDPKDQNGLAHYLEHMLFLGTKKYPEVGTYKKFLTENSGASNAYTSGTVTNYFFQVSHEGMEGALDRFSDFFKSPLFDKKYSDRELNAVNSEHDKNKRSDGWRGNYVQNLTAEKGHPLSNFGTGNKQILSSVSRQDFLKFYKKYYVGSNMKLVIMSNKSLDVQADMAKNYFSSIPGGSVELPKVDREYRKPLNNKYRLLKIKTIKDVRALSLEFPTIQLINHLEGKPGSIIGTILGYEGKGSLLSKLKSDGLVLGLSAGGGFSHPNVNSFSIDLALTKQGVAEYERVLETVFSYIKLVREHGVQKYTYDENKAMAQINFDWKNPNEGMGYVSGRASLMFNYRLEDIETLPYLYKKYEPEAYKALLQTLTPENALVVLQTNSVETDIKEDIYGAEYSLSEIGGVSFTRFNSPVPVNGMSYPEKNDFIPDNLKLVKEEPELVWDDELGKVWFQFDHRFKQPKVFMQLRIETPLVYSSARNLQLAQLYNAAVAEGLNEKVYPIQMAGLSYGLAIEKKGVVLSFGGYSERIADLLKLVIRNLKEVRIDEQKFSNIKEAMIRGLENKKFGQAYARGGYYNRLIMLGTQYTEEEKLAALKTITLQEVQDFTTKLYERVHITGMAHGNWGRNNVEDSIRTLLKELNSKPLPEADRFEQVVEVLNQSERILFSRQVKDNNNSIAYALQVGDRNMELLARLSMIADIIETDFYTEMRTNQQLGYIVWSFQQRIEESLFLRFVIQSANHSSFELNRRVEAWLKDSGKLFEKLSDEEFERYRASRIIALEKKGDSIAAVLGDLYYLATEEKGDFEYKNKLIATVKNVKKEDVIATARQILLDSQTAKMVILMRSNSSEDTVPNGVLTEVRQFKSRNGGM